MGRRVACRSWSSWAANACPADIDGQPPRPSNDNDGLRDRTCVSPSLLLSLGTARGVSVGRACAFHMQGERSDRLPVLVGFETKNVARLPGFRRCERGTARRSRRGGLVGGGEDDVGGLDDCRHVRALLEAEFAGCLHGDGGDQALAVDVDLDVGDRGALGDALDGAGELVASAELHGGCSCRWSGTFPSSLRPGSCTGGRGAWPGLSLWSSGGCAPEQLRSVAAVDVVEIEEDEAQRWLTPGVWGIGTASLLADLGMRSRERCCRRF